MKIFEIFLACLFGIGSAFSIGKWKGLNWKQKSLTIVAISLALITAYDALNDWDNKKVLEKINSSFGDINDLDNAEIPTIAMGMSDQAAAFN